MMHLKVFLYFAFQLLNLLIIDEISFYDKWKLKAQIEIKNINDSLLIKSNFSESYYISSLYLISDKFSKYNQRKIIYDNIVRNSKFSTIELFEQYGSGEVPFYTIHVMESNKEDTLKYYYDVFLKLKSQKYRDFYIENSIYANFRKFDILSYLNGSKNTKGFDFPNNFISYTRIVDFEVIEYKIIPNFNAKAIDSIYKNKIHPSKKWLHFK